MFFNTSHPVKSRIIIDPFINNMGVLYLECDSEDKDSEDNSSIWPISKNLYIRKK